MKEAAGEANMTVITIVLIGVIAAVGLLLVPRLMSTFEKRADCTDMGGIFSGNQCRFDHNLHPKHGHYCTYTKCAAGTNQAGRYRCVADCSNTD